MLIKSLVFPYLDYCAGIFLDLSNELVLKLSIYKNAALRFAMEIKKFEYISHVYAEQEILSYESRRDYLAICLLASILKSNAPSYLAADLSSLLRQGQAVRPFRIRYFHRQILVRIYEELVSPRRCVFVERYPVFCCTSISRRLG